MSYDYSDKRHLGYEDSRGTIPTSFRRRLEKEAPRLSNPGEKKLPKPRKVDEATRHCGEPPAGYERPTTWERVAESPTVLLATPTGWERCEHHVWLKEIEKPDGSKGFVVRGEAGKITKGEGVYEGVKLASLRVPGRGDKGREGAA